MSVLTVVVGVNQVDYNEVELTRGTSDALPTPTAKVTGVREEVSVGEDIFIASGGATLFTGQVARPRIREGGRRDLVCEHDLAPLFEEEVDVPDTPSVETALQNAVSNASVSASVTFVGSDVTLGEPYSADSRTVRRIFKDLTERTGRVWRIDDPDTIIVEPLGSRGTITIDTSTDAASVREFDPGDARTVVNDVTVNGTGDERVVGTASDATSISNFGKRSETVNVNYITNAGEADDYANALLRPDPLAAAKLIAGSTVTDIVSDRSNFTIDLTDPSRGISNAQLVIEEQTNTSGGSAVFQAGEGAASSLVVQNRESKSQDDTTEPGTVMPTDRIGELAITETKISDNSISTPKLQANAITANEIDTLNLATDELSIGAGLDGRIIFDDLTIAGTNETVAVMLPSNDEGSIIGLSGQRFAELFVRDVNADDVTTTNWDVDPTLTDHEQRISNLESQ